MSTINVDLFHNDKPICPYCGEAMFDAWELSLQDDDVLTVKCYRCGEEYLVSCCILTSYSTAKISKD